ncbi:hypothetical protein L0Y65_00465 [Candidatus Micrarchaeota archaeon]|nr:hypothetical protein [Candidatus Micrarchaeota archaeon]
MADELDTATKLEIYKLVLGRYRNLINEKESISISEIRQKVSPYNDFVRKLRDSMLKDIVPYDVRLHFMSAAERAMEYVRKIRTCEFAFAFWMAFSEMERLRVGTAMDKAILLAALLRSFESEDARVIVSRRGRAFVRFSYKSTPYLFVPESGSLLMGDDAMKLLSDDPIAYCFNDLVYENYEES